MDINKISFNISGSAESAIKSIDRLIVSLNRLDAVFDRSGLASSTMTKRVKVGMMSANPSVKRLDSSMKKLNTTATVGGDKFTKMVRRFAQLGVVVVTARRAFQGFTTGVQSAIAYVENLNLFMVALGKNTTRATAFIKEMSESLYVDEAQLTRVQGLFYQISEALGLSSERALTLSTNFTKLAYDLASFYNITIESAVTKLQAGLVGETEPLRRIGIIITENNLAETARLIGVKKSIRNMTEQEKIQLRYITALQQTKNAQTDLSRTLKQPENLLRVLREQFHVLLRELGNVAIPILLELTPQIIALTMALGKLARAFAKSLGYDAPIIRDDLGGYIKTIADETDGVTKSSGETVKNFAKLLKYTRDTKTSMTGIDELNVINGDTTGGGSSFDDLFSTDQAEKATGLLDLALGSYDNLMSKAKGTFDDLIAKWETLFVKVRAVFDGAFDATKEAFTTLWETIAGDGLDEDQILSGINLALATMNTVIGGILDGTTTVVENFKTLWEKYLEPILTAIAPKWMEWLEDGTLQNVIANIVEVLLTLKIATSVLSFFGYLAVLASKAGAIGILIASLTALNDIKIAFNTLDETENKGQGQEIKSRLFTALAYALPVGMFNPLLGIITFKIAFEVEDLALKALQGVIKLFGGSEQKATMATLNTSGSFMKEYFDEKRTEQFEKSYGNIPQLDQYDLFRSIFKERILGDLRAMQKLTDYFSQNPDIDFMNPSIVAMIAKKLGIVPDWGGSIPAFAKGGYPDQGSLFIAGEAGPELVGNINGKTEVIPMYANGTPGSYQYASAAMRDKDKDKEFETQTSGANLGTETIKKLRDAGKEWEFSAGKVTQDFNNLFNFVPKKLNKLFKWIASFQEDNMTEQQREGSQAVKNTLKDIGTKATAFWEGLKGTDFGQTIAGWVERLKNGEGLLGKTVKVMVKMGKGMTTLISNAFSTFASDKGVQQIFSSKGSDGKTTEQQQGLMGGVIGASLGDGPAGMIFGLAQSIMDGTLGMFVDSLPFMIEAGMDMLLNLVDGILLALPAILEAIPKVIDTIVGVLTDKDALNTIIEGLIKMVAMIAVALPDIILALVDAIPVIIETLIQVFLDNLPMFLKLGVIIASAIIEGLVNIIISGINWLIKQINKIPFVNIGYLSAVGWTKELSANMGFADGGYPVQGQMFIAREAGAELVGNIGGSTAVMNNDQIVKAVSDGVYRAVSQAMSENEKETIINLDGRRLSERLDTVKKSRGLSFGTGGY